MLADEKEDGMPQFPTDEWFQDFILRINGSGAYKKAAEAWEGDIAFLIEAEPDKQMPEDVWGYLDLWHGSCRGGGVVPAERGDASAYVIRAPYSRWKDVLRGDLDPIRGMVQGKLRVRGDLPTIIRYVNAANELVHLTGEVDTVFPDE
jgi:putative sterol carrier protein